MVFFMMEIIYEKKASEYFLENLFLNFFMNFLIQASPGIEWEVIEALDSSYIRKGFQKFELSEVM